MKNISDPHYNDEAGSLLLVWAFRFKRPVEVNA